MKNLGSIAMSDTLPASQSCHTPSFMGVTRTCYVLCRAKCKTKMGDPYLKIKNSRIATAEGHMP